MKHIKDNLDKLLKESNVELDWYTAVIYRELINDIEEANSTIEDLRKQLSNEVSDCLHFQKEADELRMILRHHEIDW